MLIGYMLENLLGLFLSLGILLLRLGQRSRNQPDTSTMIDRCSLVARRGLSCYYDCAVFFTVSIQIACIVVLARLDFGISANGMGISTAQITWSISLITMIPLMYLAFIPNLLRHPKTLHVSNSKDQGHTDRREQLRFLLFALCWMLSIYPFLSKMLETFEPSMIGSGDDSIITTQNWEIIRRTCTSALNEITERETLVMQIFGTAGSLFVSLMAIAKISWLAINRQCQDSLLLRFIRERWIDQNGRGYKLSMILFVVGPVIAITQLWTIFRLRTFQIQVSQASGNQDADSEWTFGQVVAFTIFVPVIVECCFSWRYE